MQFGNEHRYRSLICRNCQQLTIGTPIDAFDARPIGQTEDADGFLEIGCCMDFDATQILCKKSFLYKMLSLNNV